MKTMKTLCSRFNRLHPGHVALFDEFFSYPGYYNVTIVDRREGKGYGLSACYTFTTAREFREWMDGVVLD